MILDTGSAEPLKACLHGAAGALFTTFAVYNGSAFVRRGEPHLAFNALLYGAIALYEGRQTEHHVRAIPAAE